MYKLETIFFTTGKKIIIFKHYLKQLRLKFSLQNNCENKSSAQNSELRFFKLKDPKSKNLKKMKKIRFCTG